MLSKLNFITILSILALSLNTSAQTDSLNSKLPYKDDKIVFERIVEAPGIKKQTLYAASKKWISDSFKSGKSVIQSEDEATGQIVGWGYGDINLKAGLLTTSFSCKFSLQITCKDEKCRIRFYDLSEHHSPTRYTAEFNVPLESSKLIRDRKNKTIKSDTDDDVYGISGYSQHRVVKAKIAILEYFNKILEDFQTAIIKASSDEF